MNDRIRELAAHVELNDEVRIAYVLFINLKFAGVYLNSERYDQIDYWDEFLAEFGKEYYNSLEDYKKDKTKRFSDWIIENGLNTKDIWEDK
jgi:hypothetical protein